MKRIWLADDDPAIRRLLHATLRANPDDRARAEAAGADAYFTKPFSPLALLEKVEEVLGA